MVNLEPWFHKFNGWSVSRSRLWNMCQRCYYYRYIGSALTESADFNIYKLKPLKLLNSKNALQGLLLHEVIENQIGQRKLGRETNEDIMKSHFLQKLNNYRNNASNTLIEYHNGVPVDNSLFDKALLEGQAKISMFYGVIWPQLKDLEYLQHEKFDKFQIDDVNVTVKIDYVSKTNNGLIVISDWKTGEEVEESEANMQIGTYILWAMQYYRKDLSEIKSEFAYLKTGTMRSFEINEESIDRLQQHIKNEYDLMNASYEMDSFPTNPGATKCIGCQYGTLCKDSLVSKFLEDKKRHDITLDQ